MRAFALLVLTSFSAAAQTYYTWTDAQGEHFTDNPSSIPAGVKARTTGGAELNAAPAAPPEPVKATPTMEELAQQAQDRAVAADARDVERQWRSSFRTARRKIRDLEDEVSRLKGLVEEINGMPVTGRYSSCSPAAIPGPTVPGQAPATTNVLWEREWARDGLYGRGCGRGFDNWQAQRAQLARTRAELVQAKEDLADLERRAAYEAIPLEWRR